MVKSLIKNIMKFYMKIKSRAKAKERIKVLLEKTITITPEMINKRCNIPTEIPIKKMPIIRKIDKNQVFPEPKRKLIFRQGRSGNLPAPLNVQMVNFDLKENHPLHRTDHFADSAIGLIIRRRQYFKIKIKFDRNLQINDQIVLVFSVFDDKNSESLMNVTVEMVSNNVKKSTDWSAGIFETENKLVTFIIVTSISCPVSKWNLRVDTFIAGTEDIINKYNCNTYIYILFNPWHTEDPVFLDDNHDEYVLNNSAIIYTGTYSYVCETVWDVGLNKQNILACINDLISRVAPVRPSERNDPVLVSRALTSAANRNENNGLLQGTWNSSYKQLYKGSGEILQIYYKERKPLRSGQCFIFAGVVLSLCRALGIPCRIITCYESAHSDRKWLTINYYYDSNGKPISTEDAIWNFHCWNEVWIKRTDVDNTRRYDGWQVVDGTPLIELDGGYRCGPSPVAAVKQGEILTPYDTKFIYSEVNADVLAWQIFDDHEKLILQKINQCGRNISTKQCNCLAREEITDTYKYPEGSEEERDLYTKALETAHEHVHTVRSLKINLFECNINKDCPIVYGDDFKIKFKLTNRATTYVIAIGKCTLMVIPYVRNKSKIIKSYTINETISAKNSKKFDVFIKYDDYYKCFRTNDSFKINVLVKISGNGNSINDTYMDEYIITPIIPRVNVEIYERTELSAIINSTFENTFNADLKNCTFILSDSNGSNYETIKIKNIPKGTTGRAIFKYTIFYVRNFRQQDVIITVKFYSNQLHRIEGYAILSASDS